MYTISVDDVYIHSMTSEYAQVLEPVLDIGIDKTGTLTFKLPQTNPMHGKLNLLKPVVKVFCDHKEIFRGRICDDDDRDWYNTDFFIVEGELAYLIDTIQRPYDDEFTYRKFLDFVLQRHNEQVNKEKQFTLGIVNVEPKEDDVSRISTEYITTKEFFNKQVESNGGHIRIRYDGDVKYLDYIKEYTNISNQPINFGKNLIKLFRSAKGADIKTAIIPLGATVGGQPLTIESVNNGKDYIYDEDAVKKYGQIWATVSFGDIADEDELIAAAREWLANVVRPQVTIEATAVDLSIIDTDINGFSVGDQVPVISPPHNIDGYFQVNNIRLDMANPDKSEVVLGETIPSLTGIYASGKIVDGNDKRIDELWDDIKGTTTSPGLKEQVSSVTTKTNELIDKVDGTMTLAEQTADHFKWLVKSGENETNFTLTDRTAELIAKKINLGGLVQVGGLDKDVTALIEAARKVATDAENAADTADGKATAAAVAAAAAKSRADTAYNNADAAWSKAYNAEQKLANWCYSNNTTLIDGGKIYTGSLFSQDITATGTIRGVKLVGGSITGTSVSGLTGTFGSTGYDPKIGTTVTVNIGSGAVSIGNTTYGDHYIDLYGSSTFSVLGHFSTGRITASEADLASCSCSDLSVRYGLSASTITAKTALISPSGSALYLTSGSDSIIANCTYFRSTSGATYLGSSGYPWTYLYVDRIRSSATYTDGVVSQASNMFVGSSGNIVRTTNTSSRRYKEEISNITVDSLNPHNLYDIDIVQFKYKSGQLSEEDQRCSKMLPGFIVEQMVEHYPIAVDQIDGKCEAWNSQYLIPPMLSLIQEQHNEIEALKEQQAYLLERIEQNETDK